MFLWVFLVIESIETVYSLKELHEVVQALPSGLSELYGRIIGRKCDERQPQKSQRASEILKWISSSQRPLKKFELLPALALNSDKTGIDRNSMPTTQVLEICKPLIEERPNGSVTFVHFSVQECVDPSQQPHCFADSDIGS